MKKINCHIEKNLLNFILKPDDMTAPLNPEAKGTVRKKFRHFDLRNTIKLVYWARKGVRASVFYSFANSVKMPEKDLAGLLHIHPRTISNYREIEKRLAPVESEHLLKLISLFAKGEEMFGNIDEFNYWLEKPFWNSKEKPVDWLITPGGVDFISTELDRLAHAYVV